MVRLLPLALAASFLTAGLSAQSTTSVVLGLARTGFTETVGGQGPREVEPHTAVAAGVAWHRDVGAGLGLTLELLYLGKGGGDPQGDATLAFGYVEVPVSVQYRFRSTAGVTPFVAAGPALAFLASCTLRGEDGSESCDATFGEDDSYRRLDIGVQGALGLAVNRWTARIRYDHGLTDVNRSPAARTRNRAVLLLVAFDL